MRLELLFKTHVTRASTEQNSQRNLEKTGGGGAFNSRTQFILQLLRDRLKDSKSQFSIGHW